MKAMKTILKILAALAAIAAAAAAISYLIKRRNENMDELDAYLMGEEQGAHDDGEKDEQADLDYLNEDFDQLGSLEQGESITVSLLADPSVVQNAQEQLAAAGFSSTYDHEGMILDVVLAGPKDKQELDEFSDRLKALLKQKGIDYIGYALD